MMIKKYELTKQVSIVRGSQVHRIRAVKDFGNVKKGDLGGWIESEENLSQKGDCWVYDDSIVFHLAKIVDAAIVQGGAFVSGGAKICEHASVIEKAVVSDQAIIKGNSVVAGSSFVGGDAIIDGASFIDDRSTVTGNAFVTGKFPSRTTIKGRAVVSNLAHITSTNDVIVIGPIGSRDEFTTFYKTRMHDIWVSCGCFYGSLTDFEKEVKETHGGNVYEVSYLETIKYVKVLFDLTGRMNKNG